MTHRRRIGRVSNIVYFVGHKMPSKDQHLACKVHATIISKGRGQIMYACTHKKEMFEKYATVFISDLNTPPE
jgi:hypothetical protein